MYPNLTPIPGLSRFSGWIPILKNSFQVVLRRFGLVQNMCPGHSLFRLITRAGVVVLCVISRFFFLRVAPVVPSFRADQGAHFTFYKNGPGKGPPRAAEVDGIVGSASGNRAVAKNKAIGRMLLSRGRRNVSNTAVDHPKIKSTVPSI